MHKQFIFRHNLYFIVMQLFTILILINNKNPFFLNLTIQKTLLYHYTITFTTNKPKMKISIESWSLLAPLASPIHIHPLKCPSGERVHDRDHRMICQCIHQSIRQCFIPVRSLSFWPAFGPGQDITYLRIGPIYMTAIFSSRLPSYYNWGIYIERCFVFSLVADRLLWGLVWLNLFSDEEVSIDIFFFEWKLMFYKDLLWFK